MHRKQQLTPVTITVLTQCYCVDTVQQPQLTSVSHYSCVDRHQKTLVITPVLTETNIHWSRYLCWQTPTYTGHYACVDRHQHTLVTIPVSTDTNMHWSLHLCWQTPTCIGRYTCVDKHQHTLVTIPVLTDTNIHWSLYWQGRKTSTSTCHHTCH